VYRLSLRRYPSVQGSLIVHVGLGISRLGAVVVAVAGIAFVSPKLEGSSLLGDRNLVS
jgi:hypothetical protein